MLGLERERRVVAHGFHRHGRSRLQLHADHDDGCTGNKAAYAELQSEFGKRIFLAANVRGDDDESFGPHTTWRLAPAVIVPGTETKLKGSYGTGFKAPSLTQLYVNNPSFSSVANPNLQPETSKATTSASNSRCFDGRVNFGVTYFHNAVTNLINNSVRSDDLQIHQRQYRRGDDVRHGVVRLLRRQRPVELRGDYTTLMTRDEATGLGLRNRPRNKESLTVVWTPTPKFTLSTTLLYVGSAVEFNRDGTVPRVDSDAYALVNLAAEYRLDQRVTLFGRIDNLLDRHYESPVGFDQPGFGAYAGIRVSESLEELCSPGGKSRYHRVREFHRGGDHDRDSCCCRVAAARRLRRAGARRRRHPRGHRRRAQSLPVRRPGRTPSSRSTSRRN